MDDKSQMALVDVDSQLENHHGCLQDQRGLRPNKNQLGWSQPIHLSACAAERVCGSGLYVELFPIVPLKTLNNPGKGI